MLLALPGEDEMKKALCFMLLTATMGFAQQGTAQNPVTDYVRQQMARQSKTLVATAEAMPADKYSYKPTEGNMTFGHLMEHIASSNNFLCAKLTSEAAPAAAKESEGKDKIVASVKESMDYCTKAMADVKDADLTQPVELWGGHKGDKAAVVVGLTNDWSDHYGAAAIYLRLNGILPPTAQKRPQAMGMEKKK
jgi:uncharacterized damage-inducible protein DinB